MEYISKVTSKGQITLPAAWRKANTSDRVLLQERDGVLEVTPLQITRKKSSEKEYTVFDAIRDNQGKGIKAKDFVAILRKMQ